MKTGLVPVGSISRSADGSYLRLALDPKRLKEVDSQDLTGVPGSELQEGLRILVGDDGPDYLVFGKAVEKTRRTRGRAPRNPTRAD